MYVPTSGSPSYMLQTAPAILFTHLSICRPTFPADAQFPVLVTRSSAFRCTQPQLHALLTPSHIQEGTSMLLRCRYPECYVCKYLPAFALHHFLPDLFPRAHTPVIPESYAPYWTTAVFCHIHAAEPLSTIHRLCMFLIYYCYLSLA